ncbi:MAG: HNH endonuclease [Nocardioides sp.]|nr:HNH endonuclease [Nocardioides sp.]
MRGRRADRCAARVAAAQVRRRGSAGRDRGRLRCLPACTSGRAGGRPEKQGVGIAEQVALARRESPHLGRRHVGLAKVLRTEMPHTMAALRAGHITEWRATILARETACLEVEHRREIDEALAGDAEKLSGMGDRETEKAAKKLACVLNPASVAERRRRAESERTVTVRPSPDTMTWLTSSLPVRDGVAVFAALKHEAARLIAAGDERSRGQIMADTLVARVLGGAVANRVGPAIAVNVVIGVDALLGASDEPADIPGYGPIPADLVREWIRDGMAAGVEVSLRRLFADPKSGALVAMESSRRAFDGALADLIEMRDQQCRTPWCDAPIRHRDHVVKAGHGGPTSAANGQGLCEACNYAKEAIGWQAWPRPGPRHTVEVVTPTGHSYTSVAPPLTGSGPHPSPVELSPVERHLARLIRAA